MENFSIPDDLMLFPVAGKFANGELIRLMATANFSGSDLMTILIWPAWEPGIDGWSDADIAAPAVAKHGFEALDSDKGFLYKDRAAAVKDIEVIRLKKIS